MSVVEDTLTRLQAHRGVKGVIIMDREGVPIRTAFPDSETETYSAVVSQITQKAVSVVKALDPSDELTLLRIRSSKHELLIAPDREFVLCVVQDPALASSV